MDFAALWLTIRLAIASTAILAILGIPLAYWLATTQWRGRFLIEAAVAMPMLLPPTVLGFYLLVALGPQSPLGKVCLAVTGQRLPFTFAGILVGTILCNLPISVRPFVAAFTAVHRRYIEASWCLGVSRAATFFRVTLPLAWPGILTGLVLSFTHAIGEFGVVLMVGGNIPGVTRTLSVAIYDQVQALDYASANRTALALVVFSFVVLCWVQIRGRRTWG
ncbi:MAG: molybdate ABC transporter permease subunit [Pirellulaceae bacterium]